MYKWNEGKTAVDQDEVAKWPRNRYVSLLCSFAFVIHASAFLLRWFAIVRVISGKRNLIDIDIELNLFHQINDSNNNKFTITNCTEWEDCLKY